MEAYRQLYHSNENIVSDLLETIESELNDNSLNKELKKITNKLRTLLKKEENLVNLKLEEKISDSIYNEKYNELSLEKEYLAEEKVNVETTLKSEIDVKKRLTEFKQLLSSQKMLTEFDRTVFESIVEKIIVGGVNSDGEIDPAMLTIIFKTGETQNKDGKQFKSKRKNAKLEPDKLCPQNCDEDKKLYSQGTDNTDSGPHMHVDYYFVKRQNKRGMSLQVSQNGALKEQGYTPITENGKFVTPQTQFVRNSRELLRNLSKEHGLYVEEQPRSGENRRHLDTKEFKQTTKLKELENEIEEQQSWADNARVAAIEERKKLSKLQVDKENLEFWLKKNNATLEANDKLKREVKELKKEVSFLKTAINILQRAFDFGKKLFEKYNLEENGKKINLWQKFKNSFREEKGETEYENFQKVRHDTSINEVLYRHEVDYLDGTRRDAPPGLGYNR